MSEIKLSACACTERPPQPRRKEIRTKAVEGDVQREMENDPTVISKKPEMKAVTISRLHPKSFSVKAPIKGNMPSIVIILTRAENRTTYALMERAEERAFATAEVRAVATPVVLRERLCLKTASVFGGG